MTVKATIEKVLSVYEETEFCNEGGDNHMCIN